MLDPAAVNTLIVLLSIAIVLTVILFALLALWAWMIFDWLKRVDSEPEIAERYKLQMILGWPVNYYLRVYRKSGPARNS